MLSTSKLSTKGQVVIPKPLREKLGLKPGAPLAMAVSGDRLILRKITLDDILRESLANRKQGKILSHEETFQGLV